MVSAAERFARLSTPAKLLLILTAALLPIGLALGFIANDEIRQANAALETQSEEQAQIAARGIESLIARNVLALRIAASGRFNVPDACGQVQRALTIAPAIAQEFRLTSTAGRDLCTIGALGDIGDLPMIAPGDIRLAISPREDLLVIQVGAIGGMATTVVTRSELRDAATAGAGAMAGLRIRDGRREIDIVSPDQPVREGQRASITRQPIGNGRLEVIVEGRIPAVTTIDRIVILLPLLMWFIAAMMTWLMVHRLLIQPLRRLQRAVSQYEPGDPELELPNKLGPATEIQELREAFARAVTRVEESEREMGAALDGQRRMVREVHHRVKNNLQVIASLLSIHGRTADTPTARAAYGAIGRRVGALAIVHRHHYAEMEDNRGIAMRPLLAEIAAELRAGAPEAARSLRVDLDIEPLDTTQDVAVSVAFLMTEVVEFAMLNRPDEPVEITLSRTSDLTGRFSLASPVLNPDGADDKEKAQFERIIAGLAKQLRSTLSRKLGRYSVDLPVFPPRRPKESERSLRP